MVERCVACDGGLDIVVLDVDGEQAEGRDVSWVLGDDDASEAEDVDEAAGEERAGAAEGRQHEVADVEATLDRHLAQGVGLVPRGDLEDAGGAVLEVEAESLGQGLDAGTGGVDVEGDLPTEQVRGDPAEYDVGVGDRRLGAALGIAEGARVGSGGLRPDLEGAFGGDPRDRSATGARP